MKLAKILLGVSHYERMVRGKVIVFSFLGWSILLPFVVLSLKEMVNLLGQLFSLSVRCREAQKKKKNMGLGVIAKMFYAHFKLSRAGRGYIFILRI